MEPKAEASDVSEAPDLTVTTSRSHYLHFHTPRTDFEKKMERQTRLILDSSTAEGPQ